jgi:hypothetical protein
MFRQLSTIALVVLVAVGSLAVVAAAEPKEAGSKTKSPLKELTVDRAKSIPTMDQIHAAWKSRQGRTKSARFEWKEVDFIPQGMMARPLRSQDEGTGEPAVVPPDDTTMESTHSIDLSGEMLRYCHKGFEWGVEEGRPVEGSYVATFDGHVARSLFGVARVWGGQQAPVGFIEKEAQHTDYNNYHLMPVLLLYRGCDPKTGGRNLGDYAVSGKTGIIEGRRCVLVEKSHPSSFVETFWLDADRDFIVLRVVDSMPGGQQTTDISYRKDGAYGFVPTTWRHVEIGCPSGVVFGHTSGTETKCEVNGAIVPGEFDCEFPVGTVVKDLRAGTTFITLAGVKQRMVTNDEINRGASYDEMLATESGQAGIKSRSGLVRPIAVVVSLFLFILLVVLTYWRSRIARAQRKPVTWNSIGSIGSD